MNIIRRLWYWLTGRACVAHVVPTGVDFSKYHAIPDPWLDELGIIVDK